MVTMTTLDTAPNTREDLPGEVYTRRWVVEAILDLVGYTADRDLTRAKILEPSCGTGAFILPIIERLLDSAELHNTTFEDLTDTVLGIDLQQHHVIQTRRAVTDLLLERGADLKTAQRLAQQWIICGDYLLDETPTGVDFVVGNPPYIRSDDLDPTLNALYRSAWSTMRGRADLYVGFLEKSLVSLAPGGKLGVICADRWMHNAYGKHLRGLISSRYAVEHIWHMHGVDAFEKIVSAYPAVTILANSSQKTAVLLEARQGFNASSMREIEEFLASARTETSTLLWEGAKLPTWFTTDDFWPSGSPHTIKILEELQQRFPTLESDDSTKIGIGVATGADQVYIVDRGNLPHVEAHRLLPLVMADDIRSGKLTQPTKLLLNPWDTAGNLIHIDDAPELRTILEASPAVKRRYIAKKYPHAWYRTIDKVNPALTAKPKLLFQDMKTNITPVYEPGGYYPHHNLYYITSDTWDLEVLGGILLSDIAQAFVYAYGVKMRGGTLRFQAQYLRKIAVPPQKDIPEHIQEALKSAFRAGNRTAATEAAYTAYGIAPTSLRR